MKKRQKKGIAKQKGKPKNNKALYWSPRIISIIFIAFLSLFALDILSMGLGFWETILGLFMHLIPNFLLIIILLIAWKKPLVGGILFIIPGLLYILVLIIRRAPLSWSIMIAGPAFLIGILFILEKIMKKK